MKNFRSIFLVAGTIIILSLSNCIYYKSLEVTDSYSSQLDTLAKTKSTVLIENKYSDAMYKIDSLVFSDVGFYGNVTYMPRIHESKAKSFIKKSSKQKLYGIYPPQSMHIYLNTNDMINEGFFKADYSDIESVEVHDNAVGKTVLVNTVIPLVLIGIPIIIILASYSLTISLY